MKNDWIVRMGPEHNDCIRIILGLCFGVKFYGCTKTEMNNHQCRGKGSKRDLRYRICYSRCSTQNVQGGTYWLLEVDRNMWRWQNFSHARSSKLVLIRNIVLQARSTNWSTYLRVLKRNVQSQPFAGRVCSNTTVRVGLCHKLLPASIHEQTNEVRSHVVTTKVSKNLGKVVLIEVNLRHWSARPNLGWGQSWLLTSTYSKPSKSLSGLTTRVPSGL